MKRDINKMIIGATIVATMVTGCGVDGSLGDPREGNGTDNPSDINLTKAISENKVPGYSASDTLDKQYTSVINYLRKTSIKCNDKRAARGPQEFSLTWNAALAHAAKEHSEDMMHNNFFENDGSGTVHDITSEADGLERGSKYTERIKRHGYTGSIMSENIDHNRTDYELPSNHWIEVMEKWIKSTDGHCSNIMLYSFHDFGMYESRTNVDGNGTHDAYWTLDLGGPF